MAMRIDCRRTFTRLLWGVLLVLIWVPLAKGETRVTLREVSLPLEDSLLSPKTLQDTGLLDPLQEEKIWERFQEIPYDDSKDIPESRRTLRQKMLSSQTPLELALMDEKAFFKKKVFRIPVHETSSDNGWAPLSEEERLAREAALKEKAIDMGMELADALSIPYVSEHLLHSTEQLHAYRKYLAEQYRLHFDISKDNAILSYNLRY